MDYDNVNDLCDDLQFEVKHIHDLSDYGLDGRHCVLKFCTMHKLWFFIKCMSTSMKDTTYELPAEYLLALTYEDFNVFWQADMIRMMSKPTSPTTPLTSHIPGSKTRKAFLPQLYDPFATSILEI